MSHWSTPKFNWDDIDVGNHELEHSQNFFAKKHFEHERPDEKENIEVINEKMHKAVLNETPVKPKEFLENDNEKENQCQVKKEIISPEDESQCKQREYLAELNNADECIAKEENTEQTEDWEDTLQPNQPTNQPLNLACQWTAQKQIACKSRRVGSNGAMPKFATSQAPRAYMSMDLYKRKKEEALRKRLEAERKMREFHSRPVPNFKTHPEQMQRRRVAVTMPITPVVLKKSREAQEKRKKLQILKCQIQPPKFESRPATVLKEEPFVPKKAPSLLELCPFNLSVEKRLADRKQFDEAVQRVREEKEKQVSVEEEELKKREEERIRELRKITTFKARPNPFKQQIKEKKEFN